MIDFNIYTVAHGEAFMNCAVKSAESFVKHNDNIKYTIFVLGDSLGIVMWINGRGRIELRYIQDWKSFPPEFIKKKPFADVCLFKSAIAPKYLSGSKYIGFVDADTICNHKLPFEFITEQLDKNKICVATDSKAYQRKSELSNYYKDWTLYFNSGVIFYDESIRCILIETFYNWALDNTKLLSTLPFNEQTWLNIFLNKFYKKKLYELGYYWNMRSSINVKEAHIWHYGRKVAESGNYE